MERRFMRLKGSGRSTDDWDTTRKTEESLRRQSDRPLVSEHWGYERTQDRHVWMGLLDDTEPAPEVWELRTRAGEGLPNLLMARPLLRRVCNTEP